MQIRTIIKNGGCTLNKNKKAVSLTGYQVSKRDLMIIAIADFNQKMLNEAVKALKCRGEYLGIWVDCDKVYIDISQRIPTKKKALEAGRVLNQISIWDWKKSNCIMCGV